MRKIRFNFAKYSDSNFEIGGQNVYKCMDGNAYFPSPTPDIAALGKAVDLYSQTLVAAQQRDRLAVAQKNAARIALQRILASLALYVMQVSAGDIAMLVSSGFPITKAREPRKIGVPGAVTLSSGLNSGEMRSSIRAVPGAASYIHFITAQPPTDDAVWESTTSTRSAITFANLKQGMRYYVRTAAVGSDGQVTQSPVSSMYVQ